jgi:hypothetical protein
MGSGSNTQMLYQAEAAFGVTNPTPDAIVMPIVSEGLDAKRNLIRSNVIRAGRNPQKPKQGKLSLGGSISTELNPFMGVLLHHAIGTVVTTGAGTNKTHVIKIGALPPSLSFEKGFLDLTTPEFFLMNGLRTNKMGFEIGPEGPLPVSMDYIGRSVTPGITSFDSTPTDFGHLGWDMSEVALLEGGSALSIGAKVAFDINNDCDGDMYVIGGNGLRHSIPEGASLVEGVLTALFENMSIVNKAINFTTSSISAALTRGTGDGSAGNEYIEFLMQELIYGMALPLVKGPKGVIVEIPFSAFWNSGAAGSALQVTLKNTQATI